MGMHLLVPEPQPPKTDRPTTPSAIQQATSEKEKKKKAQSEGLLKRSCRETRRAKSTPKQGENHAPLDRKQTPKTPQNPYKANTPKTSRDNL